MKRQHSMVECRLVGGATTFHLGFAFQPAYKALPRIGACWFALLTVFGSAPSEAA